MKRVPYVFMGSSTKSKGPEWQMKGEAPGDTKNGVAEFVCEELRSW